MSISKMHSDSWRALECSTALELPQRQLLPPALLLSPSTQGLLPVTAFLLPAEKTLHWSRKSPVCCVQPVQPPELQREGCAGRESAGFKNQLQSDGICSSLLCLSIPALLLPVSGRFSYLLCLLRCHISVQIDSNSYCTRQAWGLLN